MGVGIFVALNWKGWVAAGVKTTTNQVVSDSSLSQPDKDKIIAKVDSVMTDFENGKISMEQMGKLAENVAESPLIPLSMVMAIEAQYKTVAGLTDEERAAGKIAMERCARGIFEKKIAQTKIDDVLAPVNVPATPGSQVKLKPVGDVTADDLRKLYANAKAEADAAQIPDEPFTVDIAGELVKAIDAAIGTPPAP